MPKNVTDSLACLCDEGEDFALNEDGSRICELDKEAQDSIRTSSIYHRIEIESK